MPETPDRLAFVWNPTTGEFTPVDDPFKMQFEENLKRIQQILEYRDEPATHLELYNEWPETDTTRPSPRQLYNWLNRAYDEDRLRRVGEGTTIDPYRYRMKNTNDEYYDRGELPPLPGSEDILQARSTKKKRKKYKGGHQ